MKVWHDGSVTCPLGSVIHSALRHLKQIEFTPVNAAGEVLLEQVVRQRLVGAAVLMTLTVVALPLMFDMERAAPIRVTETMPPRPELPAIKHEMPKLVEPLQANPVPVADMYALNGDADPEALSPIEGEGVVPKTVVPKTDIAVKEVAAKPVVSPIAVQTAVNQVEPGKAASAKPVTTPLPPVPAAPGGKLNSKGVPEAWAVQVAAMSDKTKADLMIKQLKDKGFAAFAVAGKTANGSTVRVFIGPKLDKAAAVNVKKSVDQAMGLQTMVVPFAANK
jgi:DedD protein